VQEQKPINIVT